MVKFNFEVMMNIKAHSLAYDVIGVASVVGVGLWAITAIPLSPLYGIPIVLHKAMKVDRLAKLEFALIKEREKLYPNRSLKEYFEGKKTFTTSDLPWLKHEESIVKVRLEEGKYKKDVQEFSKWFVPFAGFIWWAITFQKKSDIGPNSPMHELRKIRNAIYLLEGTKAT